MSAHPGSTQYVTYNTCTLLYPLQRTLTRADYALLLALLCVHPVLRCTSHLGSVCYDASTLCILSRCTSNIAQCYRVCTLLCALQVHLPHGLSMS
jgi:hypothetical protein